MTKLSANPPKSKPQIFLWLRYKTSDRSISICQLAKISPSPPTGKFWDRPCWLAYTNPNTSAEIAPVFPEGKTGAISDQILTFSLFFFRKLTKNFHILKKFLMAFFNHTPLFHILQCLYNIFFIITICYSFLLLFAPIYSFTITIYFLRQRGANSIAETDKPLGTDPPLNPKEPSIARNQIPQH